MEATINRYEHLRMVDDVTVVIGMAACDEHAQQREYLSQAFAHAKVANRTAECTYFERQFAKLKLASPIQPMKDAHFTGQQGLQEDEAFKKKEMLERRMADNEKMRGELAQKKLDTLAELKAKYEKDALDTKGMYDDAVRKKREMTRMLFSCSWRKPRSCIPRPEKGGRW